MGWRSTKVMEGLQVCEFSHLFNHQNDVIVYNYHLIKTKTKVDLLCQLSYKVES